MKKIFRKFIRKPGRKKTSEGYQEERISDGVEGMQDMEILLGQLEIPGPSSKMDERFYLMLHEEKKRQLLGNPELHTINENRQVSRMMLRFAAGIALFFLGWIGSGWFNAGGISRDQLGKLRTEIGDLRETVVLAMLHQSSPVERIKGIDMVGKLEIVSPEIIQNLISTLENDENDNVRLATLDILIQFPRLREVRDGLIQAIPKQDSPMVQLRLAEIMEKLKEKNAVPAFQLVLDRPDLNYHVRTRLSEAVKTLI